MNEELEKDFFEEIKPLIVGTPIFKFANLSLGFSSCSFSSPSPKNGTFLFLKIDLTLCHKLIFPFFE